MNYPEVENYLLVPSAIQRVIEARISKRKTAPKISEVTKKLDEICEELKNEIFDAFSTEILSQNRNLGQGGANKEARKQMEKLWQTFEGRLSIISGKEVISRLSMGPRSV